MILQARRNQVGSPEKPTQRETAGATATATVRLTATAIVRLTVAAAQATATAQDRGMQTAVEVAHTTV